MVEVAMVNAGRSRHSAPRFVDGRQGRAPSSVNGGSTGCLGNRLGTLSRGVDAVYSITFALFQVPVGCEDDADEPDDQPLSVSLSMGSEKEFFVPARPITQRLTSSLRMA